MENLFTCLCGLYDVTNGPNWIPIF